jgi:simple sugar transport system permease protein
MELLFAIVTGTIIAATPLIYAAIGELVVERSGVLNLGVEGMMLLGAVAGFATAFAGYSPVLAALAGMIAGLLAALLFAVLALTFLTNQYAAGLALTILGSGLSAFLGRQYGAAPLTAIPPLHVPWLGDVPVLGRLLFRYDLMVYLAILIVFAVSWFLYRTKWGLIVRIIGESPQSAHAIGYPVIRIRYLTTMFGGAMAGLGGAYLAIAYTPIWVENMTAGRGFIAVVLVVFAAWRPLRLILGAWLFGGVQILELQAQGFGVAVPSEVLSALPYVATIAVLVIMSRNRKSMRLNFPLSLAQPFHPSG